MLGAISKTALIREAQASVALRSRAKRKPLVIWADPDDTDESFALSCAAPQYQGAHRILAAVPYGLEVPSGIQAVPFPRKLYELHCPPGPRNLYSSGGRGSGKSHAFGTSLLLRCISDNILALCVREIMRTINDSVHRLLCDKIDELRLGAYFEQTNRSIKCIATGSEIIFAGLFQNANGLKSLEGVSICWVEEAECVSKPSLEILIPTIRKPDSQLWFSLNPNSDDAPVMEFARGDRKDVRKTHVIFSDNPFFPEVLEGERQLMARTDPDAYAHVWEGQVRKHSAACVFAGKFVVDDFTPCVMNADDLRVLDRAAQFKNRQKRGLDKTSNQFWDGPFLGADFGFSVDPSTLVKCWIHDRQLFIEHEAYGVGVDTNRLPAMYAAVPDAHRYVIRADGARPETISALRQDGFPKMEAAKKWAGSVEDGIAFIRSFERVVIHPRCKHVIDEFRLYSYKVSRVTQDVMPDLAPGNDHMIDALRYALAPAIMRRRAPTFTQIRW